MKLILTFLSCFLMFFSYSQNTAPVAKNQTIATDNYTTLNITLVATDADNKSSIGE